MTTKNRVAAQAVSDNGAVTFRIYGTERDTAGKQSVVKTITVDTTQFPSATLSLLAAKGFGTFAEGRYTRSSPEEELKDVEAEVLALEAECVAGTFTAGRAAAGPSRPTPFHEALAQHLSATNPAIAHLLADAPYKIVEFIKANEAKFTKAVLQKMRLQPKIAALTAKITAERAKEAERAARERAKKRQGDDDTDFGALFGALSQGEPEGQVEAVTDQVAA